MYKQVFISIIAIIGFTQGLDFDKVMVIAQKTINLNLSMLEWLNIIFLLIFLWLFYRGIRLLLKIVNVFEDFFIAKAKKKLYNKEKDI